MFNVPPSPQPTRPHTTRTHHTHSSSVHIASEMTKWRGTSLSSFFRMFPRLRLRRSRGLLTSSTGSGFSSTVLFEVLAAATAAAADRNIIVIPYVFSYQTDSHGRIITVVQTHNPVSSNLHMKHYNYDRHAGIFLGFGLGSVEWV